VGRGESVEENQSQKKKRILSAVHTWYVQYRTIVPHNRDIEEHGTQTATEFIINMSYAELEHQSR